MSRRPEHQIPAELFYGVDEARRYQHSSRIQYIQRKMAERAIELLALGPELGSCHILDAGCGGGIGGECLEAAGHTWTGTDISWPMLAVARDRETEEPDSDDERAYGEGVPPMAEVIHHDLGVKLPFRPGVFDGAISISAVQWLCNAEKKGDIPQRRLKEFFTSLYGVLRRGAKAVLQFYPENTAQLDMITAAATRCGFGGGLVVDFPHSTRAKKYYLVLAAGQMAGGYRPPDPLVNGEEEYNSEAGEEGEEEEGGEGQASSEEADWEDEEGEAGEAGGEEGGSRKRARVEGRPKNHDASKKRRRERVGKVPRPKAGTKSWVLMKKQQRRQFGLATRPDSKYTHRKRKPRF